MLLLPLVDTRTGSPPRGRGKAGNDLGCLHDVGITPAWAGKSKNPYLAGALFRDHPRVGGEKVWALL